MHVFHILIRPDSLGGSKDEALKSAKKIKAKINNSNQFTKIAKLHSHDADSAAKGGELGWSSADELPPQIGNVADQLKKNGISEPIESPAGWHIIMVKDTKKVDITKDVERKKANQILFQQEMEEQLNKWLDQLKFNAYIKIIKKELQN